MAKRREKTRRQQKKNPQPNTRLHYKNRHSKHKNTKFPKHRKKAFFRNTNISKLLTGQKSGRKSRTAQNAIKLQKQAFQKIKTQNFAKCRKKAFFTQKYFQIGTCEQPLHNVSLKKPCFYKGNTLSKRFPGQVPRAQIQVCVSTKQSSWLRGGAICDFWWPFLLLPHFSSEMPIFIVRKGAVPEPAFRWTPNRAVFWRNAVPLAPVRHIYIYIFVFFVCRVRKLSKICLFWVTNLSNVSYFFLLCFSKSSFCTENEIFEEKKKKTKHYHFIVNNLSNYVAQHAWIDFWLNLGQIFDSTFLAFLSPFSFFKNCWNHYLYRVFSKTCLFAHPEK